MTRTVSSAARCLDGHFPGRPLAPGAYLLALAADALSERGLEIAAIRRVKFIGPVAPERAIEIRVVEREPGRGGGALLRWFVEGAMVAEARTELKAANG